MPFEILGHILGRESFTTQVGRTTVLTAAAASAGIQVQKLFPGKVFDPGAPVLSRGFKINGQKLTPGPQTSKNDVDGKVV